MLRRLSIAAVLVLAVAAAVVQVSSATRSTATAKTLVFCSDVSYPPEEMVTVNGKPRVRHRHRHRGREATRDAVAVREHRLRRHRRRAALEQVRRDHQRDERHAGPRKSVAFVDYLNVGQSLIGRRATR